MGISTYMINLPATPLQEYPSLAKELDMERLFVKREDMNPSGSHKDRAMFPYVDKLISAGEKEFCLSSSGNLAITAAYYANKKNNAYFHIFLPELFSAEKKKRLQEALYAQKSINPPNITIVTNGGLVENVHVCWSTRPKTDAMRFSREKKVRLLRGSTDDGMLEGYHQMAEELIEQTGGNIGSIFMAVSSGTMAVGLWEGFQSMVVTGRDLSLPSLHVVQTTKVHPIASQFDHDFTLTKTSLASAIVDRVAHRKAQVIQAVKESGGWGWVVGDSEISNAKVQISKLTEIEDISSENAMALAGLQKAIEKDFKVASPIVLVCTGK